jgi:hypothetical protein
MRDTSSVWFLITSQYRCLIRRDPAGEATSAQAEVGTPSGRSCRSLTRSGKWPTAPKVCAGIIVPHSSFKVNIPPICVGGVGHPEAAPATPVPLSGAGATPCSGEWRVWGCVPEGERTMLLDAVSIALIAFAVYGFAKLCSLIYR